MLSRSNCLAPRALGLLVEIVGLFTPCRYKPAANALCTLRCLPAVIGPFPAVAPCPPPSWRTAAPHSQSAQPARHVTPPPLGLLVSKSGCFTGVSMHCRDAQPLSDKTQMDRDGYFLHAYWLC